VLRDGPASFLTAFRTVVVDEAHDRTLCTDVLLGMVSAAVATEQMKHLKVVVWNAGGPADGVLGGFFGAPVIAFQRAVHPVEVRYSRGPMLDMVRAVVDEVAGIHRSKPPGDVLAFLPDVVRVEDAHDQLEQLGLPGMAVCVVHDHLPAKLMGNVLETAPGGARKVVLTTDVAETAVLIPGIKYVVDTGVLSEDPLERVSKEAANRRAAVAGAAAARGTATGSTWRTSTPASTSIASRTSGGEGALMKLVFILERHAAGDMPDFELLDQAVAPVLENVVGELVASGYLDKHGKLTEKGKLEAYYDED
jgi:HrpA-like RNA helicase